MSRFYSSVCRKGLTEERLLRIERSPFATLLHRTWYLFAL